MGGSGPREPPVTAHTSPARGSLTADGAFPGEVMEGSPQVGRANLTVRDRAGRTLCCHLHSLVAAPHPGQKGVQLPSVTWASLLFVCAGLHSPLSHPSLQSSLSNPNLQASLSSPQPPLQGSHSHPSLPASSLARHALPTASLGHPSLSAPALSSSTSSSSASSPVLGAPPYPASTPGTSPRHRRVPLSPLSLPAGPADARRSQQQLPKQFSPTMSPTLSSITQVRVAAFVCVCLPSPSLSLPHTPSHFLSPDTPSSLLCFLSRPSPFIPLSLLPEEHKAWGSRFPVHIPAPPLPSGLLGQVPCWL